MNYPAASSGVQTVFHDFSTIFPRFFHDLCQKSRNITDYQFLLIQPFLTSNRGKKLVLRAGMPLGVKTSSKSRRFSRYRFYTNTLLYSIHSSAWNEKWDLDGGFHTSAGNKWGKVFWSGQWCLLAGTMRRNGAVFKCQCAVRQRTGQRDWFSKPPDTPNIAR